MRSKPGILVTGANGQLGHELRVLAVSFPQFDFYFLSREQMALTDRGAVYDFFKSTHPVFCINCAAYTAVDKAENDKDAAFLINADAAGQLAAVCFENQTRLIHISTDYVFDGTSSVPYKEADHPNPVNTYGLSKLLGEELCIRNNADAIIVRTSWVYSTFGNNFLKTMVRLMREKTVVHVVNDQVGSPTYAADLARVCLSIIIRNWVPGIYHYSNSGRTSWFDFAVAIKEKTESACLVMPVPSSKYPTIARRPKFSLLDTTKIQNTFHIDIADWKESLDKCLTAMKE
jgi:dTDP-4-dehydrorhamnose reductase